MSRPLGPVDTPTEVWEGASPPRYFGGFVLSQNRRNLMKNNEPRVKVDRLTLPLRPLLSWLHCDTIHALLRMRYTTWGDLKRDAITIDRRRFCDDKLHGNNFSQFQVASKNHSFPFFAWNSAKSTKSWQKRDKSHIYTIRYDMIIRENFHTSEFGTQT